jgi:Domain of unknown function (DUF5658)
MKDRKPKSLRARFRLLWKEPLLHRESLLLVMLSAGDLFVTYSLLWHERFYEANPVARWFFERWNIAGMTVFKFGIIAFVIVLGETIEHRRPGVGRAILLLGCAAAAIVMVQGLRLLSAG